MIHRGIALEPSVTPTLEPLSGELGAAPRFALGELISGRFRIERFLGRGGLGEVYAALDVVLETEVALKILRPEWSAAPWAAASLRQEVLLARQVTHPNVCRTFDVVLHGGGGSTALPVIAMEPIIGESLAAALVRDGAYGEGEALALLEQVASGLDAAHAAGVIHRDLKAANVLLAADQQPRRAVITDFGQAVATGEGAGRSRGGTPPYIAPEVLAGDPATPAADLYAFGILMLEVRTGRRPAPSADPDEVVSFAAALLEESELPAAWHEAIRRCLARNPAARPSGARQALAELGAEKARPRPRGRLLSWVGIPLALLAATLVGALLVAPPGEPSAPVNAALTVGFLPLDDSALPAESHGYGTGLSTLLEGELAAGGTILVRSSAESSEVVDARLPSAAAGAAAALRKLGLALGCDVMIQGALTEAGAGHLELALRLVPIADSHPMREVRRTGTADELAEGVPALADELRRVLAAPPLSRAERTAARARPATLRALLLYGQGRESLRRFDPAGARRAFEAAAAEDPAYALTYAGLAEALMMLGNNRNARAAATRAAERARHLPREQRLYIEGLARAANEDWQAAVEIDRALAVFFPQNPSFGRRLALAEIAAGDAGAALKTIADLRTISLGRADRALCDLLEAEAASDLRDFSRQLEAADRILAALPEEEAPMIRAGARRERGAALHSLGRSLEGKGDLETARATYRDQGNLGAYAEVTNQLANLVGDLGDSAAAVALYREALALFRETGSERREARALSNLSVEAMLRGDLGEAEALATEALTITRRIDYRRLEGAVLNNLGLIHLAAGRPVVAVPELEGSLALGREVGNREGVLQTLANLPEPYLSLGEIEKARRAAEDLSALADQMDYPTGKVVAKLTTAGIAIAEWNLKKARAALAEAERANQGLLDVVVTTFMHLTAGQVALLEGKLGAAAGEFSAAERAAASLGDATSLGRALIGRAIVALAGGRSDEGLELARQAQKRALLGKNPLDEARAAALIAEALLRRGKEGGATRAVERAQGLVAGTESLEVETLVGLAAARLAAARGREGEALARLPELIATARSAGFSQIYFEAGLLQAELSLRTPHSEEARARAAELAREARQGGFGLFLPELERLAQRNH